MLAYKLEYWVYTYCSFSEAVVKRAASKPPICILYLFSPRQISCVTITALCSIFFKVDCFVLLLNVLVFKFALFELA